MFFEKKSPTHTTVTKFFLRGWKLRAGDP